MKKKRLRLLSLLMTSVMVVSGPMTSMAAVAEEAPIQTENVVEEADQNTDETATEANELSNGNETAETTDVPEVSETPDITEAPEASETPETAGSLVETPLQEEDTVDEPEEIVIESQDDQKEEMLSWEEFYAQEKAKYDFAAMSEEEAKQCYVDIVEAYRAYRAEYSVGDGEPAVQASADCTIKNNNIEIAAASDGKFTIGNLTGDPDYDTDDNQKLLFGHPDPGTSETLLKINDNEYFFSADSVRATSSEIIAIMNVEEENVKVIETLSFCRINSATFDDSVQIKYQIINQGTEPVEAGIRIMLDTMLANNDYAPFKVPNTGNVTETKTYIGSAVPDFYQVYDDLDNPTTLATGTLTRNGSRKPDKVEFTNWPSINDSDWDYHKADGSTLGDSAVGMWFDPVSLASSKSTTVYTYYGVGIGVKGSGSNANIRTLSSKQCGVRVTDSKGNVIEGAQITVAGQTVETESDGIAVFTLADVDHQTFEIMKEGYIACSKVLDLDQGRITDVSLKKENDDTPLITSVTMNSKNLLKEVLNYCEDSSDKISSSKNVQEAKLQVSSDMEGSVYYLLADGKRVMQNDTGVFTLKTIAGSNGDYRYIEKLKAGQVISVRCVSKDGVESEAKTLGIKIASPSLSANWSGLNGIELFDKNTYSDPNLLLKVLFAGDNKLSFGSDAKLDFNVDYDPGSGKLKVGFNVPKSFMENDRAVNEFNKAVLSHAGEDNKAKKDYYDKMIKKWRNKKIDYSVGSMSVDFNVMGYGEGTVVDGGVIIDLHIVGTVSGDVSATYNFFVGVVPLYAKVGGEAEGKADASASIDFGQKVTASKILNSMTLTTSLYVGLYGEGGVGNSYVASAGVRASGGLDASTNWKTGYSSGAVKGKLSLEVKALLFEKSIQMAEATYRLWDSNARSAESATGASEVTEEDLADVETELIPRDYLELPVQASEEDGEYVLSNTYTAAEPRLISVNGTSYRFWLKDMEGRSAENRTALVYSKKTANGWSDPIVLEDDGTADFSFSVTEDNGKIYVLWQDCNQTFGNGVDIQTVCASLDITEAVVDTAADDAIKTVSVTSDSVTDMLPRVYLKDGIQYLAWNSMSGNVFEGISENKLNYGTITSSSLGDLKTVSLDSKAVENIQIRELNGIPTILYSMNSMDDYLSQASQVTCCLPFGSAQTTQDLGIAGAQSVPLWTSFDGEDVICWYADNNIYYKKTGDLTADAVAVFAADESVKPNGDFAVVTNDSKTYLVWAAVYKEGSEEKAIFASEYKDGSFETPYRIADAGEGTITNISGIINEQGKIELSYLRVSYDENGDLVASDLVTTDGQAYVDAELADVSYSEEGTMPGSVLPVTLTIKNNGSEVLDTVQVQIGSNYTKTLNDLQIAPAGEKEVTIDDFTVENSGVQTYAVSISTDNDQNSSNGSGEIITGYTDLLLTEQGRIIQENQEMIAISLKNISNITAENVRLRVFADEVGGALLYDTAFEKLEGQEEACIAVPVSALGNSSQIYATVSTDTEQFEGTGVQRELLISNSVDTIKRVEDHAVTVQATEGGTITSAHEETYETDAEVMLSAEAQDGYVFKEWTSTDEDGTFADHTEADTTYTMGNADTVLEAVFVPEKSATGIEIDGNESVSMNVGETYSLSAIVTPTDTSERVQWSSADPNIATVSKSGKVEGITAGTVVITASCGSYKDMVTITVTEIPVTGIRMIYPSIELDGIGDSQQLDILLTPDNATQKVCWTSSDEEIATIDGDGVLTAVGTGETTVTAYSEANKAIKASCTVKVIDPLQEITVPENIQIMKGKSTDITAAFVPVDADDLEPIKWDNLSTDIVTIENSGDYNQNLKITGLKRGDAVIRASIGDVEAYCYIKVLAYADSVELDDSSVSIYRGHYTELEAWLDPSNVDDVVQWSSSNSNIVEIDSTDADDNTCEIYGVAAGTATVTATIENGQTATCSVTVLEPIPSVVNVTSLATFQSPHPYEFNMDNTWVYRNADAVAIQLTFSNDTEVEEDYDKLIIKDSGDKVVKSYTGKELAGKTITVAGNTAKVNLQSDGSIQAYGFRVTNIKPLYDIAKADISAIPSQAYTGSPVIPSVKITWGNQTLKQGTDYTLAGTNNVTLGTATLRIIGKGNYAGQTTRTFSIVMPKMGKVSNLCTISGKKTLTLSGNMKVATSGYEIQKYNSSKKKFVAFKKIAGSQLNYTIKKLRKNSTYKYRVRAYLKVGSTTAYGKYTAISGLTGISTTKLKGKALKKKASLSWKKVSNISGYEIYQSTQKSSGFKRVTTVSAGKTSKTITKLKKGTTYYFKIRAYRKMSGGMSYGAYSKTIRVKVK